jgi:hypothetical protein
MRSPTGVWERVSTACFRVWSRKCPEIECVHELPPDSSLSRRQLAARCLKTRIPFRPTPVFAAKSAKRLRRVDLTRSPSRRRMAGLCAHLPLREQLWRSVDEFGRRCEKVGATLEIVRVFSTDRPGSSPRNHHARGVAEQNRVRTGLGHQPIRQETASSSRKGASR